MIKYYYAGSTRVAMRTGAGTNETGLLWLLGDHLGSTSRAANADGTPLANGEQRYKPWGEKRYPTGASGLPTTYRFTGQRQESSLGGTGGLYFYGSRWLDPALGRFVQPDTLVPGMDNPQRWDRFGYVLNNPLRYIDPSGHREAGPCERGEICTTDQGGGNSEITGSGGDTDAGGCGGQGCDLGGNNDDDNNSDDGLTISSWEQPGWWDLDPQNPDYTVLMINVGPPGLPGLSIVFTLDRYGNIYFGLGGNYGKSLDVGSVNLVAGFVGSPFDNSMPDPLNLQESFLKGLTINGSLGVVGGGGVTWSPSAGKYIKPIAAEVGGFIPPNIGVSAVYNWKIYDIGDLYGSR